MKKLLLLFAAVLTMTANAQHAVSFANAHWGFEADEASRPNYTTNTAFAIPTSWVVGTATVTSYRPYIYPNGNQTDKADQGHTGRYCLYMNQPNSASRLPVYAMLPTVSDKQMNTLKLEFWARTFNSELDVNTSNTVYGDWKFGYITSLDDTVKANFIANVQYVQTIELTANWTKYTLDLKNFPANSYPVIYIDSMGGHNVRYAYIDDVKYVEGTTNPDQVTPATFEDVTVGPNGVYYDPNIELGANEWLNGSFVFSTFYDNSYGDYYSDVVVSSNVDPTMAADYSNPVSYLYAPTATPEGNNFAVWNQNYYGIAPVLLGEAQVVSGMYVNNTSAMINYVKSNPAFNVSFAIMVTGKNEGVQTGTITMTLADYTDGKTMLVTDWFWQDLSTLGEVDELEFLALCIDYMAPQYFCFDNLGGTHSPSGVQNTTVRKAEKVLRNGQVRILRGDRIYNAAGQVVR